MSKAQVSLEFLIASIILLSLLLFGVTIYIQQTAKSNQITETNKNMIECNKLADAITSVYTSQKTSAKTILVSKETKIERKKNPNTGDKNAGQITIGNYYCYYFGGTRRFNPPSSYTEDTATGPPLGFTLGIGTYKIENYTKPYVTFIKQ